MLFIIVFLSLIFTFFNFRISKKDWLDPAVIFSLFFLLASVMCLIALTYLNLVFHYEVVIILLISYFVFTAFNLFAHSRQLNTLEKKQSDSHLEALNIKSSITFFFICVIVFVIFLKYKHLVQLSSAYGQGGSSLSAMISVYDGLTKFQPELYQKLGVFPPSYYGSLSLISQAYGYILLYVIVNNFIVTKTIKKEQILYVLLLIVSFYMGGSRSTIMRLLTFAGLLYYVLSIRNGASFTIRRKLIRKLVWWGIVAVVVAMMTLSLYGRSNSYNTFHYLFIYIGAPLYNLDVFIQTHTLPIVQDLFGKQTFINLYSYLASEFNVEQFRYFLTLPFVRYDSTYGLGNVYTTFYQFVYDFGLTGVVPLISVIAAYYVFAYRKIRNTFTITNRIDFTLFIYAFLFNDLVMLFFSNRFYETVLSMSNIKMFIFAYIMGALLLEQSIRIGRLKIKVF